MHLIYDGVIVALRIGVRIGSLFHRKLRLFVHGRVGIFERLQTAVNTGGGPIIWIHCASLGEFEQGRPVIESLKKSLPEMRILLTFFSPSGYEVQKNYDGADIVTYLPWDTMRNARKFVSIVNPALAIFVKYEYWHYYIDTLRRSSTPVISVSAIFRENQIYFKKYGAFYRNILRNVSYFFVQNENSLRLLRTINITNAVVGGDTRFDRVYEIVQHAREIPLAAAFSEGATVMVGGSMWPEDFDALLPLIHEGRMKFIIAAHEISERFLSHMENRIKAPGIRFSRASIDTVATYQVLFIDNVGMLSSLYRYGKYAFVGGGFREGLHNILEAACYGLPVFFGNRAYMEYQEANDLIAVKSAFAVSGIAELRRAMAELEENGRYAQAAHAARSYVQRQVGATAKVISYCKSLLA